MDDHLQSLIQRMQQGVTFKDNVADLVMTDGGSGVEYRQWAGEILELVDVVTTILHSLNTRQILETAALQVSRFIAGKVYIFVEWEPTTKSFIPVVVSENFEKQQSQQGSFPLLEDALAIPLLHKVVQEKRTINLQMDDENLSAEERANLTRVGADYLALFPVFHDGSLYGILQVSGVQNEQPIRDYQIAMAQILANYTGVALSRAIMHAAAERRMIELETLRRVNLTLTASLDLQKVLDDILVHALILIQRAQDAHIFLFEHDELIFKAALWADGRKGQAWANPRQGGLTYTVARTGELILVNDMHQHELYQKAPSAWFGSIVGLPLKIGHRVVGVMTIAHPEPNSFAEDELRVLLLLSDQAAVAIENARLHDLVNQQARTDILTGLPNRRALNERLESELRRSYRYHREFSLVMMDLDGFKSVNDKFGHPLGDKVLRDIAHHMQKSIRDTDYLARYGGDEFALLLPETNRETANQLALRLQKEVSAFRVVFERDLGIQMGVSFGCATYPTDADNVDDLLCLADTDMYQHKDEAAASRDSSASK